MSFGIVKNYEVNIFEEKAEINELISSNISNLIIPFSSFSKNVNTHGLSLESEDICVKENEQEFKNILKQEFLNISPLSKARVFLSSHNNNFSI